MSQTSDKFEDADFLNEEEELFNIEPENTDEVEDQDPAQQGLDEDFLKELGQAKATPFKRSLKYFVFLLRGKAQKGVRIINFPHPRTGTMGL